MPLKIGIFEHLINSLKNQIKYFKNYIWERKNCLTKFN